MGISSEAIFKTCVDDNNAYASVYLKLIEIGSKVMTIETFIHEINELEISTILNNIGKELGNVQINEWSKIKLVFVPHLLSPHGKETLINPSIKVNGEFICEEFLI